MSKQKKFALLILLLVIATAGFSFLDGWLSSRMASKSLDLCISAARNARESFFEVYNISQHETPIDKYEYIVYSRSRRVLDHGFVDKFPEFSYPDISKWKSFIKLKIYYFGAGGDECRYYDIDKGQVSGWFWFPVGECDSLVVCADEPAFTHKLIVESIFDGSYYREFPMSLLQGWGEVLKMQQQAPVISAEFSDDKRHLKVKYLDENGEKTAETLDLYP